ncbi:hypothetical protein GGI42DRAFT_329377 [Trichoderma sp. SZMC 28013]
MLDFKAHQHAARRDQCQCQCQCPHEMRLAVSMCAPPPFSCLCSCPAAFIIASILVQAIILACTRQARISLRPSSDRSRPSRLPSTHRQARPSRGLAREERPRVDRPTNQGVTKELLDRAGGRTSVIWPFCSTVLKGLRVMRLCQIAGKRNERFCVIKVRRGDAFLSARVLNW